VNITKKEYNLETIYFATKWFDKGLKCCLVIQLYVKPFDIKIAHSFFVEREGYVLKIAKKLIVEMMMHSIFFSPFTIINGLVFKQT
jgi:hypothetical protein